MNRNDISRVLDEHRIRVMCSTRIICDCGLEFESTEEHRRHVANKLWTMLSEERGIEYLRSLIMRMLIIHPWSDGTAPDGETCCPCGHASDNPFEHNKHVCEELANAIIDTEKEWNVK